MTGSKNLSQIDTAFLHICWGNFVNGVRATVRRNAGVWFSVLLISLLPSPEVSASSKLTYHGRILGPEETPIEGKVDFKVQVLDSGKTCLLYQETHTIDEVKNGIFALTIGADEATKEAGLAASVEEVFLSQGALQGKKLSDGTNCTPADSGRALAISFSVDGGPWEVVEPTPINPVPRAIEAQSAQKVGGFGPENLLRVVDSGTPVNVAPLNLNQYNNLIDFLDNGGGGGGGSGNAIESLTGDVVANGPGNASATIQPNAVTTTKIADGAVTTSKIGSGAVTFDRIQNVSSGVLLGRASGGPSGPVQEITIGSGLNFSPTGELTATGGGGTVTNVSSTNAYLTVSNGTTSPELTLNVGTGANTVAAGDDTRIVNAVQRTGDTMTGTLNLPVNGLSVGATQLVAKDGRVGIGTDSPSVLLDVAGVMKIAGTGGEACATNDAGTIRYFGGNLEFCNGSNWQTLGVSGAGLQSLNGQTGSTQSLQVQVGGGVMAPTFASASNTHTLQLPLASDNGVTAGLISKTDYDNFSSKLSPSLGAGEIFVGNASNQATAVQPGGDVSMDSSGAFTVTGLRGRSISNVAPFDGQVLKYVGGGTNEWVPSNFSVGDLKTSGGLQQFPTNCSASQTLTWNSLTDQFACTNIAISDSAITFSSQAAGTFFAAPAASAGAPSFRALVASDIPNLDASKISAGTFDIARIPTGTTADTVAVGNDSRFPSVPCGAGNKMRWDGTAWQCEADNATDSTKVSKSGDTMTGPLELPSNGLIVGNDQLVVSGGKVGIGTASPSAKLQVEGAMVSTTKKLTSGATVDLSTSNTHVLNSVGGSTITLTNMVDGGTYNIVVADTTSRTYTFSGCNNSYFKPANAATTAGSRTIYGILTIRNGSNWDCYINWSSGYQ